jgi:hypothetical protein
MCGIVPFMVSMFAGSVYVVIDIGPPLRDAKRRRRCRRYLNLDGLPH